MYMVLEQERGHGQVLVGFQNHPWTVLLRTILWEPLSWTVLLKLYWFVNWNFNNPDQSVNCCMQNRRSEQGAGPEPCQNRGFSMCVVVPALIIIRTWRASALTRCFHEGGGRPGGWRNLRRSLFFFSSSSDCHNILFSCLSFCLCVFSFSMEGGGAVVSFLPQHKLT